MKKHLAVMIALSMLIGVSAPTYSTSQGFETLQVEAAGFTYTQDQQEALTYINSIRKQMGVPALTLDPFLNEAAQNHSNYVRINGMSGGGHDESKSKSGFTGVTHEDRLKAVGYTPKYNVTEVVTPLTDDIKTAVDQFLYAPYHRHAITSTGKTKIGIGVSEGNVVILTEGRELTTSSKDMQMEVYPYDGQTNVIRGFYGEEEPNPLKQFNVSYSGFVVSFNPQLITNSRGKVTSPFIKDVKFTLKDSKGINTPVFEEISYGGATSYFYPKEVLKANEKYTASISYVEEDSGKKMNKTWSFTTGTKAGAPYSSDTNTPPPSNGGNNGGNNGNNGGNVIGPPTEEDVYGPSKPTATGKEYADFKADQYWADDMLWAIDKKLIQGYKNVKNTKTGKYENLLKPNAPLTEYQFLTMLFRYSMPSYLASKGATMDVVYQLAKDYNLPTKGKVGAFTGANDTITRGRVAQILATFYNHKVVSQRDAVTFMYNAKISTGYDSNNKTYENFGVNDPLKRAHIVSFLRNYDKFKQTNP